MSSSATRRAIITGTFRLPRAVVDAALSTTPHDVAQLPVLICAMTRLPAADRATLIEQASKHAHLRAGGVTIQRFGASWLVELLAHGAPLVHVLPPEARRRLAWDGYSPWFIDLADLVLRRHCRALLVTNRLTAR